MTSTITHIEPSHEPCVEAGWKAWDIYFDAPTDEEFILSLRQYGSLTFLPQLRKPFFKVESHHTIIKGIMGGNMSDLAKLTYGGQLMIF